MGLFDKKVCAHCGKMCGVLDRDKLKDGQFLCWDCCELAGKKFNAFENTYEQYRALVEGDSENDLKLQAFSTSRIFYNRIFVDLTNRWVIVTDKPTFGDEDLLKKGRHVYNLNDLLLFSLDHGEIEKELSGLTTIVKTDLHAVMVFDDSFPCALNDVVVKEREIEEKGLLNKRLESLYYEEDLELMGYADDVLGAKGLTKPTPLEKGETLESLNPHAAYFNLLFDLENRDVLESEQVNRILKNLTENIGMMGGIGLPSKIRKQFGTK